MNVFVIEIDSLGGSTSYFKMTMQLITRSLLIAAILSVPSFCDGALTIIEVPLRTNDIVYDRISDRILASVPSSAGARRGNTITPINPYTGALGTSVFV